MERSTDPLEAKRARVLTLVRKSDSAARASLLRRPSRSTAPDLLEGADQYAWLELVGGTWHLVKDLCASPCDSDRLWPDSGSALDDLIEEGWSVVRPYSAQPSSGEDDPVISGYGLVRHRRRVELSLAVNDSTSDEDRRASYLYLWASGSAAQG